MDQKELIARLRRDPNAVLSGGDGGRALQQAAGEAAAGNTLQMAQMLKNVMSTPEGTALLRRIRDSLQG